MTDGDDNRNAQSHVNRIPGVSMDDAGFITTAYGRYNPVTGEGLTFQMPEALWNEIVSALIQDGLDRGFTEDFDLDAWIAERFADK